MDAIDTLRWRVVRTISPKKKERNVVRTTVEWCQS